MYYVYEWYVINTNEIFYVGKGTRNRYKVRKHNKFFDDFIKRYSCNSRIIKEFENESDAFSFEYKRIKELKEIGQCVCNIYEGGMGGSTSWWTDEQRKKYSEKNVMKSEQQRKRMSENNPMKNKEVAQKVGNTKSRKVVIGNVTYKSVKNAMEKYNTTYETIKNWCKKGINPFNEKCRFEDEQQHIFTGKRYNKGGCKPIIYNGKLYESGIDVAFEIGVRNSTISHWAKKGFSPSGIECRLLEDTTTHTYNPNRIHEISAKPIYVNGVWYPSKAIAEKSLGLSKGYLAPYIAGTRKNNKYICKYDNQQPSQTNTDNSSLEGSTTNE